MIKWEALNRPKEFGGLGFMDVRSMNTSLLAKWIDRLERGDNNLFCSLLRKKYLGHKSIFQIKNRQGSQFWRSLLDIREWYQKGRVMQVVSGQQTRFWHDTWLGEYPLKVTFPNLFKIVSYPDIDVCQAVRDGQWNILLRRQLHGTLSEEWSQLQELLSEVNLEEGRDRVGWAFEQSKKFTASSL